MRTPTAEGMEARKLEVLRRQLQGAMDAERRRIEFVEPGGRTFIYWLAAACKNARIAAELDQHDIRPLAQSRVSRFEKGRSWPDNPEEVVQGYAQCLNIKDSRELWIYAMELWLNHGRPPTRLGAESPAQPNGDDLLRRLRKTGEDANETN